MSIRGNFRKLVYRYLLGASNSYRDVYKDGDFIIRYEYNKPNILLKVYLNNNLFIVCSNEMDEIKYEMISDCGLSVKAINKYLNILKEGFDEFGHHWHWMY